MWGAGELQIEIMRTYRQLKRLLRWKPVAGTLLLLMLVSLSGYFMRTTSQSQDSQPDASGGPQADKARSETVQGIMGPRDRYIAAAEKDDLSDRLLAIEDEASEAEREQAEREARVQSALDEAEIEKHTEKPWQWLRDHEVELREDDFLLAISTRAQHLDVVRAGRRWRQGIKTVVGMDRMPTQTEKLEAIKNNEIWIYYPGSDLAGPRASGATRSAMMPLLAHEAAGSEYRWMLYGEEDTVFFIDAVQQLLMEYDWHMPYSLTDRRSPKPTALRCMPCHAPESMDPPPLEGRVFGMAVKKKPMRSVIPRGCPCKPQDLCDEDPYHEVFGEECEYPGQPRTAYSPPSGSGMILSNGLLLELKKPFFERCVQDDQSGALLEVELHASAGSYQIFSSCLWEAGFAHTDPSILLPKADQDLFDTSASKATLALASALDKTCDSSCQDMIRNMVSAHISIRTSGPEASAHTIESLARLYSLVIHARPRTNIRP